MRDNDLWLKSVSGGFKRRHGSRVSHHPASPAELSRHSRTCHMFQTDGVEIKRRLFSEGFVLVGA